MLEYYGQSPIIVRSSSLLEDGFGNAFTGKYDSVFCANQGAPAERLEAFLAAVREVYASAMSEEALRYREHRGPARPRRADGDPRAARLRARCAGRSSSRRPRGSRSPTTRGSGAGDRPPRRARPARVRARHARGRPRRRRLHAARRAERAAAGPRRASTRRASTRSAGWTCSTSPRTGSRRSRSRR